MTSAMINTTWTGGAAWGTPTRSFARMGEDAATGPVQRIII